MALTLSPSTYIQECSNAFLALFPHRFDYIYAKHPEPKQKPDWQTETRYPLSDRALIQSAYLFGVRFGSQTQYCVLDIDTNSPYHPRQDPLAIDRIVAALEAIGLVAYVACTSSDSGGIHLYFPFQETQSSWVLAAATSVILGNAGFTIKPGVLELFPNPKPYVTEGHPTLFNAHRLPMQTGSYLLNGDFQPVWGNQQTFVDQWQIIQSRNDVTRQCLKQILKQARRKQYFFSGKADKFINDLNAEIELGWTDYGQTNRLLGRITMRSYIFHHILTGDVPLTGQALVDKIVATAKSLPGYQQWCRHQHEIEDRATEWARCIENSHYFPYGDPKGKYQPKPEELSVDEAVAQLPTWNQRQSEGARERIRLAIADLLDKNSLPAAATARFQMLVSYGIGGGSLYRHRDLWHPKYLVENSTPVKNPPHPPASFEDSPFDRSEGASSRAYLTSLFPLSDGNSSQNKASSDRNSFNSQLTGGNMAPRQSSGHLPAHPYSQPTLFDISAWMEASQAAAAQAKVQQQRIREESEQQGQLARMQQFLASGDPILVAEATAWAEMNPNVLDLDRLQSPSLRASSTTEPPIPADPLNAKPQEEEQQRKSAAKPVTRTDLSDVLAAISLQLRRLEWTAAEARDRLFTQFGKPSRAMLSETELLEWLEWLEQQV
ncbi:MAG TPA: hypothetical protein V6D10_17005 [Trichocoleus sp.]|jgi:hypothetical protein